MVQQFTNDTLILLLVRYNTEYDSGGQSLTVLLIHPSNSVKTSSSGPDVLDELWELQKCKRKYTYSVGLTP